MTCGAGDTRGKSRRALVAARRYGGFTYLGVMFVVALIMIAAAGAASVWHVQQQRENETELLFVGRQFKSAIEHYSKRTKANVYPPSLAALLSDSRSLSTVRDLRKIYPDPFLHQSRWGVMLDKAGGVLGVYSLAPGRPQKIAGFEPDESFGSAKSYRDWRFLAHGADGLVSRYAIADPSGKDFEPDPDAPAVVIVPKSDADGDAPPQNQGAEDTPPPATGPAQSGSAGRRGRH